MSTRILALLAIGVFLIGACKKDNSPTRLTVTVLSPNQSAASNTSMALLTDSHPYYTFANDQKTDANGNLVFDVDANSVVYLYHYSYDGYIIADNDATYIATGVFKSADDIKYSATQTPTPNVGDTKYADINGDGVINRYDLVKKVTGPDAGKTLSVTLTLKAK